MHTRLALVGGALCTLALVGQASADVKRAEILSEIQAAFSVWEQIDCTDLKFKFAGELTSWQETRKGAILVYFGYDAKTWPSAQVNAAYYTDTETATDALGDIDTAVIAMNAGTFSWSIGKEGGAIDIRTAVVHMIAPALGFYVGPDPGGGSLGAFISYNMVDSTLTSLHKYGAQFDYPKTGCAALPKPPICGKGGIFADSGPSPALDGGAKDAGPAREAGAKDGAAREVSTKDLASTKDTAPAVDAGPPNQLCIYHTLPNTPANGKPYHWFKQPIEYYVYIPPYGNIPGGAMPPKPDGGPDRGPAKPDTGGGGGQPSDSGCCRVGHTGRDNAGAGLVALAALAVLLAARRRRR
jgi:hypothetical protein